MSPSADVKVGLVRVQDIRFHPHNVRRDLGDLRPLAESLASFGLMQPVVVERVGDHLRLRAGHRRVAAAKIAGLTRIPAVIHDERLNDENWLVHSVQENVMRRGLDAQERNRAAQALLDLGCSYDGVAETFGVSASAVRTWLNPTQKKRTDRNRSAVKVNTIRSFVEQWRTEAQTRPVTVAELLDAIEVMGKTGRLADALPDRAAA